MTTMWGVRRTYLVRGHGEGVNVALLRGVVVREVELRRIQ